MWAEFDGCREHGRMKFTNSPRTYRSGKHQRLVCFKNSIDFFLNKNKPFYLPSVTGGRACIDNYCDGTSH